MLVSVGGARVNPLGYRHNHAPMYPLAYQFYTSALGGLAGLSVCPNGKAPGSVGDLDSKMKVGR